MNVAPVQDDKTGQQQRLVVVVVVRNPSHAPGQQHASFPLVMEDQSQQGHHQDEDDGTADDGVGDAGVVTQTVVQSHKVLARSFCSSQAQFLVAVVLTVVLAVAQEAAVYTAAVSTLEASLRTHQRVACAVLFVAPVGTVAEPVAAEASDDAVDAVGAGEERRSTL